MSNLRLYISSVLAALLLASCAVAPRDGEPPDGTTRVLGFHAERRLWGVDAAAPRVGEPPGGATSALGFHTERLERIEAAAQRLVAEGSIAGAVVLLARNGEIGHFEAYGHHDVAALQPMRRDALFRICSMTKAVTSVAALILYEEGHFLLDDPAERFLPELAQPMVLAGPPAEDGAAPALEPAKRPITVRHLLTHTSGITYRFFGQPVISELYVQAGITDGLAETELDLATNVRRIAAQPLLHHPGEGFTYGLSTDVLGRLVEVVSGKPLGAFLEERIFAPLGMTDTGFTVNEEQRERLPTVYRTDRGAPEALTDGPHVEGPLVFSASYPYSGPRRYQSGGAGLVTTALDYLRFCRMLAGGGELDGARILGRKTVELMAADHLAALDPRPAQAFGLGLGLSPGPGPSSSIVTRGTWSWDGFYTTRFWIDQEEGLIGLILTQTFPYDSGRALDRLVAAAYQALE